MMHVAIPSCDTVSYDEYCSGNRWKTRQKDLYQTPKVGYDAIDERME